jgi:hypothetical protein
VQIAHSIREQIINYKKITMDKREDFKMLEDLSLMKKSTRSLLESSSSFTNIKQAYTTVQITEQNYLRQIRQVYADGTDNLYEWEPRIEVLDPNEIKKFEKLEDRQQRYLTSLHW